MTTNSTATTAVAAAATALPLFFQRVEVLDPSVHGKLKLDRTLGFRFAAGTNSIPICLDEVIVASDYFPVVFSQANATPMVVVGCRDGENLFVDDSGRWLPGAYIPAYLRTWPFIAGGADENSDKAFIAVEPDAAHLRNNEGNPLFEDNKPSQMMDEIISLCTSYRNNMKETRKFGRSLDESGLLHGRGAGVKFRDGDTIRLSGFKALDIEKFNRLSDGQIVAWKNNGWLAVLYAILRSSARWARLIDAAEGRRSVIADSVKAGMANTGG